MKIHEYQARALLAEAGIAVPPGSAVESVEQAVAAAERLLGDGRQGGDVARALVIKAQVHAGGRGKAGFVKLCRSVPEVRAAADFMLNNRMISPQTGPEGLQVRRLLVAVAVDIAREIYLAVTVDRGRRTNTMIASAEGGVDIETVAHTRPEAILKEPLHPLSGLQPFQARRLAFGLGLIGRQVTQSVDIMMRLSELFTRTDASLAEINPLVVTPPDAKHPDGQVLAIDAKFTFDDNALYRQPRIADLFDPAEENPSELRAHAHGLSYVALDGTIGCLVNGAGLAMSTMDIIKLHGAEPANFLDVGGSAGEEAVREAFDIILADPKVNGVLVNIFGGIMPCDRIARGIVGAAKSAGFRVPLVVRLEGTNVEPARRILDDARGELPTMVQARDLDEAARKVCAAVA